MIVCANQRKWGGIEVFQRSALAQKLGIYADAEMLSRFLTGEFFKHWQHEVFYCSRQHSAANNDFVPAVPGLQGRTNFLAHSFYIPEIEASVWIAGSADTDKGKLRIYDCFGIVCCRAKIV